MLCWLNDLKSSEFVVLVIRPRHMGWAEHVARMLEIINTCGIFDGET